MIRLLCHGNGWKRNSTLMKRRRILLLLALTAFVAMAFVVLWPSGPKEPVYDGKRFTFWIKEAQGIVPRFSQPMPVQRREAACKAIQSMGTNALPYLLSELTRPISQWRISFNNWADGKRLVPFRFRDEAARLARAADGLYILGPDSAAALPVLAGLLADEQRGYKAARAMSGAGALAFPYLLAAIDSGIDGTNRVTARHALSALGDMARDDEAAVRIVAQFLTHTNGIKRRWAVSHFAGDESGVESHAELVVPALTAALSDPDRGVPLHAASALGRIGPKAKAAVPELLRLMKQPAHSAAASNAVFHIDPSALTARGHSTDENSR